LCETNYLAHQVTFNPSQSHHNHNHNHNHDHAPPGGSSPDNTFEVTLTKGSKGLGFSFIMCDVDPRARALGSVVRVKQLFPQQPARQNGRIREGDVILAIDGQRLKDLIYPVTARLPRF